MVRNVNVSLYLLQINLEGEEIYPDILYLGIHYKVVVSITPQPFCPPVQYKWNRRMGGPGVALDILRKDKL
jgi:hypothetical protein